MARSSSWKDRWVCIGGGTAGFGLQLAQRFARHGANVAIVGRDRHRGDSAVASLNSIGGGKFVAFSVDLADENSIAVSDWKSWLQETNLDVAIAAAGKSDRGFLMQLSKGDVEALLSTNFYSSFCFSKATQEALQREAGTLVHIASLAGIVASPGMGGYSIAKHAVVAMSRQLRLELAETGIRVFLVCPGPIQREPSAIGRYDDLVKGRELPESLKKPGGSANLKAIDPALLCNRVISGIESGQKELILPSKVRWLASLSGLWPALLDYAIKKRSST